jgi:crotonobetainyl-CoA:carnitine CoA-transferase CaiB-like acyl-CoA transferase
VRLYRVADGWLGVAAHSQQQAASLSALLGLDGTLSVDEPSIGSMAAQLEARLSRLSTEEALDRMTVAGIPAVSVLPRGAVYDDPWLAENGFFHRIDQPGIGPATVVSGYATWLGPAVGYRGHAPANGEHTYQVLQSAGFDDDRIHALLRSGAAHLPAG